MKNESIVLKKLNNVKVTHSYGMLTPDFKDGFPHSHSHSEIFIQISGKLDVFVEKNFYKITEHTVRIYASGELHSGKTAEEGWGEWYQISIPQKFFSSVYQPLKKVLFERNMGEKNVFVSKKYEETENLMKEIFSFHNSSDKLTQCIAMSNVLKTLCILNETENNITDYSAWNLEEIKKIVEIINENCICINSLEDLSSLTHYSPSYLNKLFKKYLDITPYKFVVARKLDNAKKYLKDGKNVTQASELAGFNDYNNFITLFKKTFRITPKKYQIQKTKKQYN